MIQLGHTLSVAFIIFDEGASDGRIARESSPLECVWVLGIRVRIRKESTDFYSFNEPSNYVEKKRGVSPPARTRIAVRQREIALPNGL